MKWEQNSNLARISFNVMRIKFGCDENWDLDRVRINWDEMKMRFRDNEKEIWIRLN